MYILSSLAQQLPTTAIGLILTQDLGLGPAEITAYYTLVFQPWSFKSVRTPYPSSPTITLYTKHDNASLKYLLTTHFPTFTGGWVDHRLVSYLREAKTTLSRGDVHLDCAVLFSLRFIRT